MPGRSLFQHADNNDRIIHHNILICSVFVCCHERHVRWKATSSPVNLSIDQLIYYWLFYQLRQIFLRKQKLLASKFAPKLLSTIIFLWLYCEYYTVIRSTLCKITASGNERWIVHSRLDLWKCADRQMLSPPTSEPQPASHLTVNS